MHCCAEHWAAKKHDTADQPMPARGQPFKRGCFNDMQVHPRVSVPIRQETDRWPVTPASSVEEFQVEETEAGRRTKSARSSVMPMIHCHCPTPEHSSSSHDIAVTLVYVKPQTTVSEMPANTKRAWHRESTVSLEGLRVGHWRAALWAERGQRLMRKLREAKPRSSWHRSAVSTVSTDREAETQGPGFSETGSRSSELHSFPTSTADFEKRRTHNQQIHRGPFIS
jgi:hypothetical protein